MSAFTDVRDRVQGQLTTYVRTIKQKVLGVNNEHLDFVMDSFYKLNPAQRNGVLAILIGVIVSFVLFAFFLYFVQVNSLRNELNRTFVALNELKNLRSEEAIEADRFNKLVDVVGRKTRNLTFKPFFEKISHEAKIPLKGIGERSGESDPNNPLYEKLTKVQLDMRLAKVSIPRLLNFLVDIEKSGHFLRVQGLKITGQYGNKLYFDVDLVIRGWKVNR